jgi:hypothetical protein
VTARFDAIELAARWLVGRERDRAESMIGKLTRWLAEIRAALSTSSASSPCGWREGRRSS